MTTGSRIDGVEWKMVELDDGTFGIRIDGRDEILVVDGTPGKMRMKDVSMAVHELLVQRQREYAGAGPDGGLDHGDRRRLA